MTVIINRVREEWGALGNMAPFEIKSRGVIWPRAEHLFQALRLKKPEHREEVRAIKNPMAAKMHAKKLMREHPTLVCVTPLSEADLASMKMVLRLKLRQHAEIQESLLLTGDHEIIEDATKRQRGSGLFWGAALQNDGTWKGQNWLGKLWMELRDELMVSCCDTMKAQLNYECEEHGLDCPDIVIRYHWDYDHFSLYAPNAEYACDYCPWCGTKLPDRESNVEAG